MTTPTPADGLVSIKPLNDLRVRKPNGQLLDPAGEEVMWSGYWRRRELEGDIERADVEQAPAEGAKPGRLAKASTTPPSAE